jgi:adenosine 3'-phospho 5'-phosphosulfate transporter B2
MEAVQMVQGLQTLYREQGTTAVLASKPVRVAGCVIGIVGSLILYGLLQERIMTQPYGVEGERFQYSVFLVLNNRTISTLVAFVVLRLKGLATAPVAKIHEYCLVSLSNVVATTCQYEALKYVSFPVQTLGKCAKMIPVMIWGSIIMRRSYTAQKYLIAALVTGGCTAFLLGGEVISKHAKKSTDTSMYGVLLMLGYLGFDGFTSTFQDKLFKGYKMETYNQMLYVNLTSATVSLFGLVTSGALFPAISFVTRHPTSFMDMSLLSIAATTGQLIILYTIKEFGALLFATIMTTRQFLSILLSCVIFVHPLSLTQWAATCVIFGALYMEAFGKKGHSEPEAEKPAYEALKSTEEGTAASLALSELKGQATTTTK